MCGAHPAASNCGRPIVDPCDAQLLESLDGTDYVDDRIHSANFVERNSLGGQSVHTAFRGSEQLKCADRALADPGRQIALFYYGDQISDMPVSAVPCSMIVMVHVVVMMLLGVLV